MSSSAPLKIPYEEIVSITGNFADVNVIREGGLGTVYKATLSQSGESVDVVVRRLDHSYWMQDIAYAKEVSMLSTLEHKNLVSLVGFCNDNNEMLVVNKHVARGNLYIYLNDPIQLTWMRRLKISVGVASALSYMHGHEGRNYSVIHHNVNSTTILVDENWEAKLSDFELSMRIPEGHLDPVYERIGVGTYKSDAFSFGIVLFEILCGTKAFVSNDQDNTFQTSLAIFHYEHKTLHKLVDPDLFSQMDPQSFTIFSQTAYDCLKERRAPPNMHQVLGRLEKALKLQEKYENNEQSSTAVRKGPSSDRLKLKLKQLKHMKIQLKDIVSATKNFAPEYCILSGGFGMVYKTELEHVDREYCFAIEGENEQIPMRSSIVAVKRIFDMEDESGEQGFYAEIDMLTSCKHPNIVTLFGFCNEGSAMILVYEYASNGSLVDYLTGKSNTTKDSWVQRMKICLQVAKGLSYLHTSEGDRKEIVHRDIKSANILLDANFNAKIGDFGLCKYLYSVNEEHNTLYSREIAGTKLYMDPQYAKEGKLRKELDIYCLGVVMFEMLCGRLAYDPFFSSRNNPGLAPTARRHFLNGTVEEIVDIRMKKRNREQSFKMFSQIAIRCLAEAQADRPTLEYVIKELEEALPFQEKYKENLKVSFKYIKQATQNFRDDSLIGHGDSGNVYKGYTDINGHNIIAVKRLDKKSSQGEAKFMTELDILLEYVHENVIGLVGYCDEEEEKIIVYEFAPRGSLDWYLSNDSLTWVMRLKICIDIAIGLEFLHGTVSSPEMVIHRDISSSNVLLFDDWKAKISGFGLSIVCPKNQDADYVIDNVTGTIGYRDPLHSKTGFLTKESDIFSLGAVLFDILCGKLSSEKLDDEYLYLPFLAKHHYHVEKLDKLVFKGIKEQIAPQSYITFTRIALKCIHHTRERRPSADEVVIQLKKALEFQEDYEKWEPKLPKDYKEIIKMSKYPENYSIIKKEDLYNIFSEGILLQQDKVLLSLAGNGERNEMVSATMFSYINSCPHEWKSLPESRFEAVVEILDISNMIIEIKTRAQFLSPNVVYGVYLVFKFCDSRNCSSKPMYVNLKYRKGHESLHAYFATRRDEQWMMIELHRFSNLNEDVVFEFLLESFSIYYWGDGAIFLEGIEFRAVDRVKYEENRKLKEVQQVLQPNFNVDQVQQLPTKFEEIFKKQGNYDEFFWLGEVNGKKLLVLSPKAALFKFSNVDLFTSIPSAESRFQDVIELLPQQAFFLKCTIRSQMLSPDTEYVCYLVFKLSETCQGLHYPVKVRDVLHQENNDAEFVYFITPSPLNTHSFTRVPKQRKDGWMEIQVWKFNSAHEFKDDYLSMNMKFTSLEGIMCGLIVSGLEFRPL